MSMQSLLVSNNYTSLKEALFCAGTYETALARALWQFCDAVVASRAALLRELREMPELRRGVPSQQYPMFGAAWPYIRSRHGHHRKTKQRDYDKHSILDSKGSGCWWRAYTIRDIASFDHDRYRIRAEYVRHPAESQQEKRIAKRVSNKRRRAEDKREIAREMDLWARDGLAERILRAQETLASISAHGAAFAGARGSGNVFVPAHQECFAGKYVYGGVPVRIESAFDPRNFDDYDFYND